MFTCCLCGEEYVITSSLCLECNKVRKLCHLYSRDTVCEILENVLLRKKVGISKKTDSESKTFAIKNE